MCDARGAMCEFDYRKTRKRASRLAPRASVKGPHRAKYYNDWMFLLRFVALLMLVIWVGGLLALGAVAAPAIFDVLAARPDGGRMLAGAVFGEILRRFHLITYAAGAILLATLLLRRVLGPAPRRFAWRAGLATLMLAASAYSGIVVAGDIAALQRQIGVAPSSLPDGDARRLRFGRLHGLSTALQLVPLLGGLMLIYWEIKE
jgi:hypothetical protein